MARLRFASGVVNPRDILVDRHGRTLAAGEGYRRGGDQSRGAIGRISPDGRPDRSFSADGFSIPKSFKRVLPLRLAFAPRGRIVMMGLYEAFPSKGIFVARYRPDGRLDRTFSGDGHRLFRGGSTQSWGGLAVDGRGRIVLGGGAWKGTGKRRTDIFSLIRLLPNGQLDRTFSGNGRVRLDPSPASDYLTDLTIDRRGRIVVVGDSSYEAGSIVRFHPDGHLDRSFASKGKKTLSYSVPESVSVDKKGRIIVVGSGDSGQVDRLRPNGKDDPTFHDNVSGISYQDNHFLDSRNRIVVGGLAGQVAVARILNP